MDDFNEALIACIKACGGSKVVGVRLWPEKAPDAAQRLLLDCLNDERPARLAPDQVVMVLRMARERGCHVGMQFLCDELGYSEPTPTDPKDELADLLRQSIEESKETQRRQARIERLLEQQQQRAPQLRSAA